MRQASLTSSEASKLGQAMLDCAQQLVYVQQLLESAEDLRNVNTLINTLYFVENRLRFLAKQHTHMVTHDPS